MTFTKAVWGIPRFISMDRFAFPSKLETGCTACTPTSRIRAIFCSQNVFLNPISPIPLFPRLPCTWRSSRYLRCRHKHAKDTGSKYPSGVSVGSQVGTGKAVIVRCSRLKKPWHFCRAALGVSLELFTSEAALPFLVDLIRIRYDIRLYRVFFYGEAH